MNGNHHRLSTARFGLGSIESEKNSLEARKRRKIGRGIMDSSEVDSREEREIGENDETEVRIRGKEGVIEPMTEGIGAGTRIRRRERIGDGGVGSGGGEGRDSRMVGIGEGHEGIGGRRG